MAREKKAAKKAPAGAKLEEYYQLVKGRVYRYDFQSPEWPYNNVMTIRAKNIKTAGGKTMADIEESFPDPDDAPDNGLHVHEWKVERSATGVKERWPHEKVENWVLRTPLEKGATWESNESKFKIASLTAKVEVPAGVYENCLHVTYASEGIGTGELFYAKGVGMVRSSQRGEWVPYDYKLESVSQERVSAASAPAKTKAAAGSLRRMMVRKGQQGPV